MRSWIPKQQRNPNENLKLNPVEGEFHKIGRKRKFKFPPKFIDKLKDSTQLLEEKILAEQNSRQKEEE